ncbi:hypothetical protein T265_03629 [Opisthorchis viverrini]|uniref:Uncharacterized protein n=1 Tax=Opisthorchis viverrini TaxID=6198 RepID=A0A075A2P6_OPIVI|nr:hypothetical protein T265_03629 [Opisthorchis viverrini]KER29835.1 hypothetical protein T265_03629 [Opisthorchis viverrini]
MSRLARKQWSHGNEVTIADWMQAGLGYLVGPATKPSVSIVQPSRHPQHGRYDSDRHNREIDAVDTTAGSDNNRLGSWPGPAPRTSVLCGDGGCASEGTNVEVSELCLRNYRKVPVTGCTLLENAM